MFDDVTLDEARSLRTLLAACILGLLVLPATAGAAPTTDVDDDARVDRLRQARMQQQTLHLLTSSRVQAQEQALRLVIQYAHVDTLDAQFYRPLAPALATVATSSENEGLQIMAVSALATIGTPPALQQLRSVSARLESGRVHDVAERALTRHELEQKAAQLERRARRVVWRDW